MMGKVGEMTLTDFLLARIAEDEAGARAAATYSANWSTADEFNETVMLAPGDTLGHTFDSAYGQIAPHIARHDPARVLAECEAKRRIVEGLRWAIDDTYWVGDLDTHATGEQAERTLEALALPYADHPDYRDEWRP